jgi:osmoprotectant transport system ATP-binding protein
MPPVRFDNVSHFYGARKVINSISFSIKEKATTVIIGKSGSGKSTLLQMINGLIIPTHGNVFIFDSKIDYDHIHKLRLHIGYSVQGTGLFPHMNVYDNIALLARIAKWDKANIDHRIDLLMRFVDLDPSYKRKYPHQLSGGEQQRVGICRAMILNPKIFLLDEPFGSLDPATRKEIHQELLTLQKAEPRTIVMVTHDLREAIKLADNILIIHDGIIQQFASTQVIMEQPANDFVRSFIHSQVEND